MLTFPSRESIQTIEFQILKHGKWRRGEFFAGPVRVTNPADVSQSFNLHHDAARTSSAHPGRMTLDRPGRVIIAGSTTRWVIDFNGSV